MRETVCHCFVSSFLPLSPPGVWIAAARCPLNLLPPGSTRAPSEKVTLPTDEGVLVSTVSSFKARYEEAPNEFQKSTLRRERAAAPAGILPNLVTDKDRIGFCG